MKIASFIGNQHNERDFSLSWEMDSCYGPKNSVKYRANDTYWDRCCLSPGVYTLICKNNLGPYGWGNSFIEILGQRYCNDFVGYKSFRKVNVTGKFK